MHPFSTDGLQGPAAFFGGAFMVVIYAILLIAAILWFFLPFAVFRLRRELIQAHERIARMEVSMATAVQHLRNLDQKTPWPETSADGADAAGRVDTRPIIPER